MWEEEHNKGVPSLEKINVFFVNCFATEKYLMTFFGSPKTFPDKNMPKQIFHKFLCFASQFRLQIGKKCQEIERFVRNRDKSKAFDGTNYRKSIDLEKF